MDFAVSANWRRARILATLGALPVLAGCATAFEPEAQPLAPAIAIPQQWHTEADAAGGAGLDAAAEAAFWRQVGDPLVAALVERAIASNRDLDSALARLDQSRAALRQSRAGLLPRADASARASRDLGDNARDGLPLSVGVDASWELDLFGQVSAGVRAAEADLAAQGYALADLQRLIAGQVAIGALNARAQAAQLAIARDTLAYQEENLQIARWRNQAGLVSSLDVEQARAQRAQTAATIPSLEAGLAASANALSTLTGEVPGPVLEAFAASRAERLAAPPPLAAIAAPAQVLARRPDVRAAEQNLLAASARIGVARAQLLPLVRLSANIGSGPATLGNLFDAVAGGLAASIGQILFDGGRARAGVDGAEAAARGALAQWEQTLLAALEEVETALADRQAADERVGLALEAVDAASNSAILARSQYEAGLTDFRTLLTAENQLLSARNQLVAAEADRAGAFIRLAQALGGGWDPAALASAAPIETTNGDRIR